MLENTEEDFKKFLTLLHHGVDRELIIYQRQDVSWNGTETSVTCLLL
jgi:hypothetical protein